MIQALFDLQFLRPQWLWALAALPPLALWWWRRREREDAWRRRVDPHLLPHLIEAGPGRHRQGRLAMALAAAVLAILALAGPGWQHQPQPLWQDASPLVVALDLSAATGANDLPPSRLLQARAAVADLLRARAGGQVALVAFADDAFTVAPLTDDAANVQLFLDALSPDIMPVDGSRPARAIDWSARLLRQGGFERGDILLLTHDADAAAQRAAATAARGGYTVSVLALGTAQGATYRDADGRIQRSRLDAAALRAVAQAGSGRYAELAGSEAGAFPLPGGTTMAGDSRAGQVAVRADQGYWLLLPLLLLAALLFRRGGVLVLALVVGLPWAPAQAQDGGWWQRADQAAHARAQAGVEAYRRGEYDAAERLWQDLPGAQAAYNRGNALARAGRFQDALDAYDAALALQPGMEDAVANRRAVEAAMQRSPPQGPGEDPAGRPSEGGQPGDSGDTQSDRGGEGERPDGQPPGGEEADRDEPPPGPADAQAQQEADQAQRERMREADPERAGEEDGAEAAAGIAESLDQREQREANEAWLQRIPDDPGGLLRARFRLEHERRSRERAD